MKVVHNFEFDKGDSARPGGQPFIEGLSTVIRIGCGDQRSVSHCATVRAGNWNLEHQASGTDGPCVAPHHLCHTFFTWSTEVCDSAGRGLLCQVDQSFGYFSCGDRLRDHLRDDAHRTERHLCANLAGEFVELGGSKNRPRHGSGANNPFLVHLSGVVRVRGSVDSHDGQRR